MNENHIRVRLCVDALPTFCFPRQVWEPSGRIVVNAVSQVYHQSSREKLELAATLNTRASLGVSEPLPVKV
jgi:hypothetical protein